MIWTFHSSLCYFLTQIDMLICHPRILLFLLGPILSILHLAEFMTNRLYAGILLCGFRHWTFDQNHILENACIIIEGRLTNRIE
ncbi:unnamed protein product [Triticum turgidum subsp. durum]|uniref:Uncharacterized protein n=1 Tax=Triticum turgidum subsp. durum TaxID=4567 RepID=A0A9R0ZF90_TRITD|nr:unnamed protein product [Triticum turgidum subsp. durum]